MQGAGESQEVAGRVSAAVAYHLLITSADDKQAEAAAWLAKLDSPLLQHASLQPGTTIKVLLSAMHHDTCIHLRLHCMASRQNERQAVFRHSPCSTPQTRFT